MQCSSAWQKLTRKIKPFHISDIGHGQEARVFITAQVARENGRVKLEIASPDIM
jgi:hypothetical protein